MALVACAALLAGCFGYNSSAKKWAYVGDTVLLLGGGGALAYGIQNKPAPCDDTTDSGACPYHSEIRGPMVAGAVLIAAGIVGIIYTATRDNVKSSH